MIEFSVQPGSVTYSIVIFAILIAIIQYIKPACLYNQNGSFKIFGLGYRNKTIVPIWLVVLILAILSYVAGMVITQPKLNY